MSQLQDSIAAHFRQAELERRSAQRQIILNNAALLKDEARNDPETVQALAAIRQAEAAKLIEAHNTAMRRWTFWARLRFLFTRRLP